MSNRNLDKLNILVHAIKTVRGHDDDTPDFVEELKACAYNIVRENPGIDRSEWIDTLIRQYPTEVVDAYGTNPPEVYHALSDLWEMDYPNPKTNVWASFACWSEYLATDPEALQDRLEEAHERIRELENEIALLKAERNKRLSEPRNDENNINPHRTVLNAAGTPSEDSGGEFTNRREQ